MDRLLADYQELRDAYDQSCAELIEANKYNGWHQQAVMELERLRAENAELVKVLEDCANDLAIEIRQRYQGTLDYPSQNRKYGLDMGPVNKARALLLKTANRTLYELDGDGAGDE